ncbi:MAG: EAL domain-containing protein [Microcoleaceae cyanobacterium MO_207.B10]|nr:EAL domain-containing protein [Microcoleaceae cyanobacterium MO_207.B10]
MWHKQKETEAKARSNPRLAKSEYWLETIATAFEEKRFCLHSQNIFSINNQELNSKHSEILLRLEDKTGEIILPGKFLPTAERYNLMLAIDRWVIKTLFTEISKVVKIQPLFVYEINLSQATVNDENFIQFLRQQFEIYEIYPETISLGISESIAVTNFNQVGKLISVFKDIGCHFTLDNVGRNKLIPDYLKKLPIDFMKIDSKLVQGFLTNTEKLRDIEKINEIGDKLGIKTIAEAVENSYVIKEMQKVGVNYAQGYGIERPQPFILNG